MFLLCLILYIYFVQRIPTSFSKNFIEKKKQIVKLWVDDRMWHVSLTVHWRKALKLSAGWAAFAKGNCLTEGDVCIFELLDRNNISLKVYIFRCWLLWCLVCLDRVLLCWVPLLFVRTFCGCFGRPYGFLPHFGSVFFSFGNKRNIWISDGLWVNIALFSTSYVQTSNYFN